MCIKRVRVQPYDSDIRYIPLNIIENAEKFGFFVKACTANYVHEIRLTSIRSVVITKLLQNVRIYKYNDNGVIIETAEKIDSNMETVEVILHRQLAEESLDPRTETIGDICGLFCESAAEYLKHIDTHNMYFNHLRCDICGNLFVAKEDLSRHMAIDHRMFHVKFVQKSLGISSRCAQHE